MSASEEPLIRAGGGIGLFGGTFDPVHQGHLRAAEEVSRALALDRLVFIPSARPPHKSGANGEPVASASDRLAWLRLAIAKRPGFEVDPIEIERNGPSFSVDTLQTFRNRLKQRPPVFVIGSDAFALISTWREPEALFELADFAVMTRPPLSHATISDWLPEPFHGLFDFSANERSARHRTAETTIQLVEIAALEISSSLIRDRIAHGEDVEQLLPETVRCAVLESRHYGNNDHEDLITLGNRGSGSDAFD